MLAPLGPPPTNLLSHGVLALHQHHITMDAFYSIGVFAVSQDEDLVVPGGAKGDYPAGSSGVYEIHLPPGDIHSQ